MRLRLVGSLLLLAVGFVALSLTRGQDRPAAPAAPPAPPSPAAAPPAAPLTPLVDYAKLAPFQQQLLLSCQRGAEWLYCMNGVKGRFVHGRLPALRADLEGDHFLRQVGAAYALARAARLTGEERYAARAAQALLALLDETQTDVHDPQARCPVLPSSVVNRLGASGLLVLAVHELPDPQADLLDKAEQLCRFIHLQARPDGSLRCHDVADGKADEADDAVSVREYPGLALYGLMRSCKRRPAPWKLDLARKALGYYRPWWREHKDRAFAPWQTAAYTEAFLLTREQAFADFVLEMNDWLCGLQYPPDARRPLWSGGFMGCVDGRTAETAPQIDSATCAESLAHACRVAREAADVRRLQRYTETAERALQFLATLQYTEGNTQHYADWYRPRLVGAFYASHQDGNLRIDYTQQALSAMAAYLEQGAR
jgi:hypothetical protein